MMRTPFALKHWSVVLLMAAMTMLFTACGDDDDVIVPVITIQKPALYITQPETTMTVRFTTSKAVSASVNAMPKGWIVEVDIRRGIISVTSPKADDAEAEDSGTVVIYAYSESDYATSAELFVSREEPIDLSAQRANCYVITTCDETYKIPITRKGESDEVITPASVGLVWQTPGSLVPFVESFEEGFLTFHLDGDSKGNFLPGNALVAAYDEKGEILWTWHLWFTSTEPEAIGGYMDRNLGANHTLHATHEEILQSYGTYYQWGRMTPFVPPATYNCADSRDAYMYDVGSASLSYLTYLPTSAEITPEWAVSHPLTFLLGSEQSDYNWMEAPSDELWTSTQKSLYDPCPKGWRVAPNFEGFTRVDDLSTDMAELEAQYGWTLSHEGEELFFPACGRRSWLRGLITNVNTMEVPKPWIGYYWTANSYGGVWAESLYFSLDTENATASEFDPEMLQAKANGMQVRCVRDN